MSANPWDKWFWNDWDNDVGLKLCSSGAQGLWMRMLCIMARSDPKGYLMVAGKKVSVEELAAIHGKPVEEVQSQVDELASREVYSVDRRGVIFNRKMVRNEKKARTARENGKKNARNFEDNSEIEGNNDEQLSDENKTANSPSVTNEGTKGITDAPGISHKPESISHKPDSNPPKMGGVKGRQEMEGFPEFYAVFPKKVARRSAEKAYRAARKRASASEILAGAKRYAQAVRGKEPQYIKQPDGWLRDDRWLDGAVTPIGPPELALEQDSRDGWGHTEREWGNMVRGFAAAGIWPIDEGPKPGEKGCRAPVAILQRHGIQPFNDARQADPGEGERKQAGQKS